MKNEQLTKQVYATIKGLYDYGVREVVISPGSRSTPISMACELHTGITTYIHPDERSAAFFALGLIKATKRPVAIVCTSGTAASNYMPAVSEADISNLPLVIMTSDRPHDLRNVGAPQAINQVNMFNNFVRYEVDFPIADDYEAPHDFVQATLMQASKHFNGPNVGPVHFNMPFREPLIPDLKATALLKPERVKQVTYQKSFDEQIVKSILLKGRGMIFVGDCQNQDLSQLLTFAAIHHMPIFADPLSQLRHLNHPHVFATGDSLFKVTKKFRPGFVIRVGKPLVSKAINQWLQTLDCPQLLIQNVVKPDTYPIVPSIHLELSANDCFRQLSNLHPLPNKGWVEMFRHLDHVIQNVIKQHVHSVQDEGTMVAKIMNQLEEGHVLFLGNSMPIRDCDTFYLSGHSIPYCNRGANGIDGVVSTAMGMSVHKKVTLIIGDISFYHDMNGLIMKKLAKCDIQIIVLNNNGGGIFSYLPQSAEQSMFERLFGTPLNLDFKHTASLYGMTYERVDMFNINSNAELVEVMTDREENTKMHKLLFSAIERAVHAELSLD